MTVASCNRISSVKTLIFCCSISYLGFGLAYSYFALQLEQIVFVVLPVALGIFAALLQASGSATSVEPIRDAFAFNIALVSLVLIAIAYLSFVFVPTGYFGMDKVERAQYVSSLYPARLGLFGCIVPLSSVCIHGKGSTSESTRFLIHSCFFLIFVFGMIELNREVFVCLGISWFFIKQYSEKPLRMLHIASFFILGLLGMFTFKYFSYLILFSSEYEGGLFAVGELVNWARWTFTVLQNDYSISELQRNDINYLFQSIVYPFGLVPSSSELLFSEILGRTGRGESYGYSGPLWTYRYGYIASFVLWATVFTFFIRLEKSPKYTSTIIMLCIAMVSFRLFRSEWPLVLKTMLWTYLYPSICISIFAEISSGYRIRILDVNRS